MSARDDQVLIEKLKSLPPQRRAEVEDFVDFLRGRETDQHLARAAAQASEPPFKSVWDNPDDAEYDRL
ncbi:MAG TPA: toxin-antitoxin system, antitoxin component, Xre family protein [Gammaproteobacteria bacterium]|nr:toxin-antitoxin system, antitoxin component, Xre family protein [Gammaproteobacteria bacterium]